MAYIKDINENTPAGGDKITFGDDEIRDFKSAVKLSFPNVAGPVTATHDDLNNSLQTLSINGQDLTISNGNTVTLPQPDTPTLYATDILLDNTNLPTTCVNVHCAIDELYNNNPDAVDVTFDDTNAGTGSNNVQGAIEDVDSRLDTLRSEYDVHGHYGTEVSYNSGGNTFITGNTMQSAMDQVDNKFSNINATDVYYDNGTITVSVQSELDAQDGRIDELEQYPTSWTNISTFYNGYTNDSWSAAVRKLNNSTVLLKFDVEVTPSSALSENHDVFSLPTGFAPSETYRMTAAHGNGTFGTVAGNQHHVIIGTNGRVKSSRPLNANSTYRFAGLITYPI